MMPPRCSVRLSIRRRSRSIRLPSICLLDPWLLKQTGGQQRFPGLTELCAISMFRQLCMSPTGTMVTWSSVTLFSLTMQHLCHDLQGMGGKDRHPPPQALECGEHTLTAYLSRGQPLLTGTTLKPFSQWPLSLYMINGAGHGDSRPSGLYAPS